VSFEFRPAKRENVPLLIGLAGGTGSGKTWSALEIAKGLAGGKRFAVIDTENGRAKHYADNFDFDVADLVAPFRPNRYADAIHGAAEAGYPVIVVDSMSHEWAGDGGCLDWHDDLMGGDQKKNLAAWIEPKREHKKMVTALLQVPAHVILCFRAEPKVEAIMENGRTKIVPKASLTGLDGWLPISEKGLPYELTTSFLLMADAPGVPRPIKLPEDLRALVPLDAPLSQNVGAALGEWARGGTDSGRDGMADSPPSVSSGNQGDDSTPAAPDIPEALALTTEIMDFAVRLNADVELVAKSITDNAEKNADEPSKHLSWLKRQRTTLRNRIDEQPDPDSPFKAPAGATA
jgi:hypothetical protein